MSTSPHRDGVADFADDAAPESLGKRLVRGAIGGIVAGIPFAVITMWFAASTGGGWLAPLKLISTIALGADALEAAQPSPGWASSSTSCSQRSSEWCSHW